MRRITGIIVASLLLSLPSMALAHEPTPVDADSQAYGDTWPLLGPGGATGGTVDGLLAGANLRAERVGGNPAPSAVHSASGHGTQTHTLTGFQCTAPKSDATASGEPGEVYDVTIHSEAPFYHSDRANGIVEATGSFFVPFDLTGDDAEEVDELWFGFLHTFPWPASSALCSGPFPLPGAYYEYYRGDRTRADGWEIPVNTLLVPDGAYGAVLRAVDAEGNTLATEFVYANVNNYLNDANWQPGTPAGCDSYPGTDEPSCPYHDVTPPHPVVKGAEGDGKLGKTQEACPTGVAFEYGEPLVSFSVNTGTHTEYTPPEREVDAYPMVAVFSEVWGPGYCVTGASGDITATAVDQSDNVGITTVNP